MDIMNTANQAVESVQKMMAGAKASVLMTAEVGDLDAIELLTAQHREVDALFMEFEQAGERAFRTKEKIYEKIALKLKLHTELEEQHFYPAARRVDKDLIGEAHEEHDVVKELMAKLNRLEAEDSTYDYKVKVLKELVHHHVREEETELFPKCKKEMGQEALDAAGEAMHEEALRRDPEMKQAKKDMEGSDPH